MAYNNLPNTKFNTIVIDPPWPISMTGKRAIARNQRPNRLPYATLSLDEIKAFPVSSLVNTGGHVYLWATNATLRPAFDVLDSWGVRFHLCLPLLKVSGIAPCNGYVFGAEYCLLGFMGRPMQRFMKMGKLNWLTTAPRNGQHSVKPDEFYGLVETMSPSPWLDCFARRTRPTWFSWGDELSEV